MVIGSFRKFRNLSTGLLALALGSMNGINAQNIRSYADKSVLSSGHTVKIRVQEEGLYSFSYNELRNMGFTNPKNVHLRGYGGEMLNEDFDEVNQYVDDLADQPVVDLGDRVVFYLRGVTGLIKSSIVSMDYIGLSENYASDYSYYFLHEENSEAKRIEFAEALPEEDQKNTTFKDIKWQKFDDVNVSKSGRNWYGSKFSNGNSKTFTFNFNNLVIGEIGNIHSNVMSASPTSSTFLLKTDLTSLEKNLSSENKHNHIYGDEAMMNAEFTQKNSNTVSATFVYNTASATGAGYIDYIMAAANCHLKGNLDYQLIPVQPSSIERNITYAALNSNPNVQVWDVSEIGNVKRVPTRMSKDSLIFTVMTRPTVGRYIMVNWNANAQTPEVVGNVENQNLHAMKDIEYVVVTNSEFAKQAKEIADFHHDTDGMSVAVVTSDQVFNEFSSGTPDPTAIRSFMKMLWDKANSADYGIYPQYLLLVGDGTYDLRGRLKIAEYNNYNKMVTYQSLKSLEESNSFSSDDYFGYLEDSTFGYDRQYLNKQLNIGIGRFPVTKASQIETLIDKIKQYYASEPGEWRTKVVALGDDNEESGTSSGYHTFLSHQEEAMFALERKEPRMNISKIYWDDYNCDKSGGTRRYPEVTSAITKKISEGALIVNYLGHGSFSAISAEHSYSITQAQSIYNKYLPVWYAGSCNVSQYDDFNPCLGEEIILNPQGGAIASIGSVRVSISTSNLSLNKEFLRAIFDPYNDFRLGKIFRAAKSARAGDYYRQLYVLLGDPGLKLKVPELNLVVDSIYTLNRDGSKTKADTLKALSKVKMYCHVEDEEGNYLNQFNGVVNASFKDKAKKVYTKGNKTIIVTVDGKDVEKQVDLFPYSTFNSLLYSGSTNVTNGKFELQMIIPKDINYKVGYGRLSMYGYDETQGWDAMGANNDILIGGTETDIDTDSIGPSIVLSVNGGSYKDGYKVNPTPTITIKLTDENGINTCGNSVGHNITMTIDDNTKNVISLNSYFKYDMSSWTDGSVVYHIEDALSEGWHTIKIKAWDMRSNSSEATIRIYVVKNLAPDIEIFSVYPNPAKEDFNIFIKTNRSNEVQTVECKLSDILGREISRKELTDKPTDGIWNIQWDLHENVKKAPGIYLLQVRIATKESDFAEKTEKIVVIAQ